MKTIALRVDETLHRTVHDEAERLNVAVSTVGRELLARGLAAGAGLAPAAASAVEAFRLELVGAGLPEMRRATLSQIETGVDAIRDAMTAQLLKLVAEARELCVDAYCQHGAIPLDASRAQKGHEPLMAWDAEGGVRRLCDRVGVGWSQPLHGVPADTRALIEAKIGEPVLVRHAGAREDQPGDPGWPDLTCQDTKPDGEPSGRRPRLEEAGTVPSR